MSDASPADEAAQLLVALPTSAVNRGCRRPAASHRWLVDVVARHGSAVDDRGLFELPSTQAALADEAGCSAGTIQARIRVLERHGHVVSRRPLTVRLTAPVGHEPRRQKAAESAAAPTAWVGRAPSDEALPHLLAANAALAAALAVCPRQELLEAQRSVIRAISRASHQLADPTPNLADRTTIPADRGAKPADPRGYGPDPRVSAADPRVSVADPRLSEGESVSKNSSLTRENPSNSLTFKARGSATRSTSARGSPAAPRMGEQVTPPEDIDELIGPLDALAGRCGLVGVLDRKGLYEALGPYSPDAIRHALAQVYRKAEAGGLHSPFGWLIAAAHRGDPDLFRTPPDARVTARSSPRPAEVDVEAEQALAAADSEQLAHLDGLIRGAAHYAPVLDRIFSSPTSLQAARVEVWRTLQEVP